MKTIIKFDHTEIEEYEIHQYERPISINNTDINKIAVSYNLPFGKQVLNKSLVTKMIKKIYLHAYSVQK